MERAREWLTLVGWRNIAYVVFVPLLVPLACLWRRRVQKVSMPVGEHRRPSRTSGVAHRHPHAWNC
jgi:hypothetical protein